MSQVSADEAPRLIEVAPKDLDIKGLVAPDEEILIQMQSDLDAAGRYISGWLIVTSQRVVFIPAGGAATTVSMEQVRAARTEALVGGGRLEIECKQAPTIRVPYSASLSGKFSEAARGIEQLRQGQPLSIKAQLDQIRCPQCDRILPEKNGICPACLRKWDTLKRIGTYLKPYKGTALGLGLLSLLMTGAQMVPPQITRYMVNEIFPEDTARGMDELLGLLGLMVLGLVGVHLVSWGAEFAHGWVVSWLSAQVTADIRAQLYRCLERLSLQTYDKRQGGAMMTRVTRDSDSLDSFLVDGLPYLIINGLMIAGILSWLLYTSWKVTLLLLLPMPLVGIWGHLFWRRMRRLFFRSGHGWSQLNTRLNEALYGIRVVKAFAQEKREIASFDRSNEELTDITVRTSRNWTVFSSTMTLVTGLGVIIVWLFGGLEVIDGDLDMGDLLAVYFYMWLIYGPIQWFGEVNSWMTRAFAGAERIFEIIDSEAEAYEDPQAVAMPQMQGAVRFRGVTFGYDKSKPVLKDIDLDVPAGEMIGLVGKSGVGKTTTVNLIARFYDVDYGAIEIDGLDLRQIRLADLRQRIGIVLQDPFLFKGTIAENISYGRPGAALEDIMEAGRAANAHAFILAKPDGYDTQVGERGGGLSGGEKQRISIARAILHDPRILILILDEATSSVDVQTEKQIQEAIARLVQGRTTFAIAHRLSTLRNADRLVVLEGGKIVEMGTHAELLEREGVFAELVRLQQEVAQIIGVKE
ncbi:MAG: ATP-binding cassette domain-containing protein [Candidatus Latescibacteria bacterium]|nr:ATP-binding cassette domain-containing protein [Candidatus Latescibacterota bacterium]